MMKKAKSFNVGDKVFAKVKGYPAWPAKIMAENGKKYEVSFYGTKETGSIKVEDLFYYLKHKDQFYRNLKRKDYQEAVEQIEAEIKESGTDGNNDDDSETDPPAASDALDKKGKKRKRESVGEEVHVNKFHKSISEDLSELQAQEENTEDKPVTADEEVKNSSQSVTRSGRVVKLKKFSDDEDEDTKKNAKVKKTIDQTGNENQNSDLALLDDKKVKVVTEDAIDHMEKDPDQDQEEISEVELKETASPVTEINEAESSAPLKVEEAVDVNIVPIDHLEAIIAYAEHIKFKAAIYKKRKMEASDSFENEVVIAKLPSNKLIGIKYNQRTSACDNEYEKAIEDAQEAKRVLAIKNKLENESVTMESEKDNIIVNITADEESPQQKHESKILERKKTKLKYLKIEANLVDYDCKIKSCLALDKADPKKAYEYMDLMMGLEITALMLKKHPLIVDVMKRLRRYIGNVKEWKLSGDSLETFETDAEKIRQKAEEVFMKFVALFNVSDTSSFWDVFNSEIEKFEEETKDLSENELFSLCAEPNSRQAFFDSYEDKKDVEKLDKNTAKLEEKEKENSIDVANTAQVEV
ncbi:hypothetical protein AMK59_6662 [Oryctes borbonicus]|uniref:PWWP domain-containing protein n=1 Tax=Oryctes borbonicus TaxID=1629725 RepID=A0A0T6AUM0_9SCAR|nr:hypothetical protein AMK59_6662 [Oryctes borbonicus]